MLVIGTRVCILPPSVNRTSTGVIYNYVPSRQWPYHVRPDDWPENEPGIAYTEEELEPIIQLQNGDMLPEQ